MTTKMKLSPLLATGKRLLEATKDCRADMHEPDEQGIGAVVSGNVFDNAGFDDEITVTITNGKPGVRSEKFNLADLIALARIGAQARLAEINKGASDD